MMYTLDGYMAGCNLGHWISQFGNAEKEHFDTYITESDFQRMADWGCDHVRLPVDYFIFEKDDAPGIYLEDGLFYIDNTLRWCKKYGLNMVLDLHHAPGFFFGNGDRNDLFTNAENRARFIGIWKFFARRYHTEGDNLRFELLNELVWENTEPWNDLWQETAEEILKISPDRKIVIGCNKCCNVRELCNLTVVENPNIIYTFHMYDPYLFTHQRASWSGETRNYTRQVVYPFMLDDYWDFYQIYCHDFMKHDEPVGKEYLRRILEPALRFMEKNRRPLYLGEYGVIRFADVDSSVRWYADVADLCLEYGIGRSVWSYRGFARITDENNQIVDDRIILEIARR